MRFHRERMPDLTLSQDLHRLSAPDQSALPQQVDVDDRARGELGELTQVDE
jgi:hypothetical protein